LASASESLRLLITVSRASLQPVVRDCDTQLAPPLPKWSYLSWVACITSTSVYVASLNHWLTLGPANKPDQPSSWPRLNTYYVKARMSLHERSYQKRWRLQKHKQEFLLREALHSGAVYGVVILCSDQTWVNYILASSSSSFYLFIKQFQ